MLNKESVAKLLSQNTQSECYVAFPVLESKTDSEVETDINCFKKLGYFSYIRTTEFGKEIVVVSENCHGNT